VVLKAFTIPHSLLDRADEVIEYSSLRCSRRLMLRVRSCCHWFSLSPSSSCYSRPYAQWSACTYRGHTRRAMPATPSHVES